MIEVQALRVHYGDQQALNDLSLHIPQGQFVLVTGPSGCGKSTLARAIAGLIPHAISAGMEGCVVVDGLNTRQHPLPDLARQVGVVLQNPASQLFHLSVVNEVAFGPRNLELAEGEVQQRVEWALAAVGLHGFHQRRPSDLSGGEKQRLAIAAALAMQPQVLVLDEPTASLDYQGTQSVLQTLSDLNRNQDMTIILIEHRLAAAMPLAQRLLIMDEGQIVADGDPQILLQDAELRQQYGLRRPRTTARSRWQALVSINGGSHEEQQPLLRFQGVTAGYRHVPVLHDIDLILYRGEFAALVGENGAGKSTLALVAAGLLKPAQGRVHFLNGNRPRPGRDVALLFQNPAEQIFTDSVGDEIAFGPRNYGNYDRTFHHETLSTADLLQLRRRCPIQLSVGQQQRTVLASCIALRPQLLILDEPTLGQDWTHLQNMMDFVHQLNEQGTSILLISHDYKLVYRYATRVLLMESGRIRRDGRPQEQPAATFME